MDRVRQRGQRPGGCGRRDGLAGLAAATGWFEVPVDGFAGHAEGFGDLGDGVLAFTVVAFLLVHAAGHRSLPGRQLGLAAADPAAGPGGFQPSRAPSEIRAASISSIAASTWKVNRPAGVVVSMPCLSTTRSIPRSWGSAAISVRWRTERAIRDSRVTASSSPQRR
jgi:hypothetical protein